LTVSRRAGNRASTRHVHILDLTRHAAGTVLTRPSVPDDHSAGKHLMTPPTAPAGTQAIQRAASILNEVGRAGMRGIGVADLVQLLPIERPTLHRILMCLLAEGLVGRDARTKRFFLGRTLFTLGQAAALRFDLRRICAPALSRISARTGDAVLLIELDGEDGVVIDSRDGPSSVRNMPLRIGDRRPLGVGASGLAILMAFADDEVSRFLDDNARRLRAYNVVSDRLMPSLRKFRRRGFAVSRGYGGLCGLAIPLRDDQDRPLGAISVTAATPRMTAHHRSDVLAALQGELARVDARLHARP
jgi:DNA-binding IclR family transcriptional regulator